MRNGIQSFCKRLRVELGVLGCLVCASSGNVLDAVEGGFTNVTTVAGIDYVHYGEDFEVTAEHQILTGGAAAGDYDGDGWVDLFVTRLDDTDILYRNLGATRGESGSWFEAQPTSIGIDVLDRTSGASWGDIDNDGDLDLYVSVIEGPRFYLYVNNGDGTFTEEGGLRGAALESDLDHQGYSVSFGDFDRDGWLDIHTCEWDIDNSDPASINHSVLLRNRGSEAPGHFENVTEAAGVVLDHGEKQYAFASSFSDLDGDGWPDLVIAGDFGTSRIFWNNQDGTFTDGTVEAGVNKGKNEMGSAIADFNKDGLLDWFVTSTDFDNRMYLNLGNRMFNEVAAELDIENGGWGWGTQLFDFENDGDYDLIMTNGWHIFAEPDNKDLFATLSYFWINEGGTMTQVLAEQFGLRDDEEGKGLLTFDYDRDGDLDIFIANNGASPVLYRNDQNENNAWLQIKLQGNRSNTRGIGARLEVTPTIGSEPQLYEMTGASHFCGQSEGMIHVGLGQQSTPVHAVRIQWPSGQSQELSGLEIGKRHLIEEPPVMDYQNWLPKHFNEAQRSNAELVDLLSDPDFDGIKNLIEYAMDLDPWSPDADVSLLEINSQGGMLHFSHPRTREFQDLIFNYEFSRDLQNWEALNDPEVAIVPQDGRDQVQLTISDTLPMFLRVRTELKSLLDSN